MSEEQTRIPTAFISYSWDSPGHKYWVLKLAEQLRQMGIDVTLDQWDSRIGKDKSAWMTKQITSSDRVIMVCSERYVQRAENDPASSVAFEGSIIRSEIASNVDTYKFIPVIRSNTLGKMPAYMGSRVYIDFRNNKEFRDKLEELAREIHNMPELIKPPIGSNKFSSVVSQTSVVNGRFKDITSFKQFFSSEAWFNDQLKAARTGLVGSKLDAFMEIYFAIADPLRKNQVELFNAAQASQILQFGWPIGLVFDDEFSPKPRNEGITAEIRGKERNRNSYDYWAIRNTGDFYSLISLFEDTRTTDSIFYDTRIVRTTEALLYYFRLLENLKVENDPVIGIQILHRGLAGRKLLPAVSQKIPVLNPKTCDENEVYSSLVVSLSSLKGGALVENVITLLAPLFRLFGFTEFDRSVYEKIINDFVAPITVRVPMKCGKCGEVVVYEIIAPVPGIDAKSWQFVCSSGHEMRNAKEEYEVVDLKKYDESKLKKVIV